MNAKSAEGVWCCRRIGPYVPDFSLDNRVDNIMDNLKGCYDSAVTERSYLKSHPWLTFQYDSRNLGPLTWAHLGESFSKCQHLIGTPLQPGVALHMSELFLRRGALASAAIEGNTLNEDQAEDILVRNQKLPESQQYLEQELRNVVQAMTDVRSEVISDDEFKITPEWIRQKHLTLMRELELEEHVIGGEFRTVSVGVGSYRGAPAEDIELLVEHLCVWLNEMLASARTCESTDERFFRSFFAATLAHLYIAWIHPFGDGNGRTARIVECAILAHSQTVPWVSTGILSNYYNKTKTRYYLRLDAASRDMDIDGFIAYCAIGFRDELRAQISEVQEQQRRVAWINYVHERFKDEPSNDIARRRRELVLAMPARQQFTRKDLRVLTTNLARLYATTSDRLFSRDLTKLKELGLIRETRRGNYVSSISKMDAFVPRPEFGVRLPVVIDEDSMPLDLAEDSE